MVAGLSTPWSEPEHYEQRISNQPTAEVTAA
jgi:hypothetical protein